jgi:hypothetical protein
VQAQLNSLIDTSLLKQNNEAIVDYLKNLFIIQNARIACPKTTPEKQVTVVLDIFTHSEAIKTEDSNEEIGDQTAATILQTYCAGGSDVEDKDDPLEQLNQPKSKKKLTNYNEIPYKPVDQTVQALYSDESDEEEVEIDMNDPLEQLNQTVPTKQLKNNGSKIYKNFSPKARNLVAKRKSPFKPIIFKQCPKCNLKKATEYHISRHDPIPVNCPHCKKVCPDQFRLAFHKASCFKAKLEFSCEICGKCVMGKTNFKNHMNGHLPNEKRRFGCDQCDKRFNHALHLYVEKVYVNQILI